MNGIDFHRNIGKYYKKWGFLKSTLFDIKIEEDEVLFLGGGLGHGVGLCQFGSQKLAKNGFNFIQILQFYYPNMQVENF